MSTYGVEGLVSSVESQVVFDEGEVALVDIDSVGLEDCADFPDDGFGRRLDAVVARHLVDVVAVQLVEVEDGLVLEHGVNVDTLRGQALFAAIIFADDSSPDVLDFTDDGLVRRLFDHV